MAIQIEPKALTARMAFIVHLTDAEPGMMMGRVEHVPSGHSIRFGSIAELADFMCRAVRDLDNGETTQRR
ncbi:MAG TPA: hypothetical protein VEL28_22960 [Candidatus Binatia bacterium]|nr:hypothetical protein [Candidatus Binatia bacterium]